METLKARYRALPVMSWTLAFLAGSVWLYFAPFTRGKMAGVLRTEDSLTLLGAIVFALSVAFVMLLLIYAFRTILGLPALKSDGRTIKTYVFPFRSIPILSIDCIIIGSNDVELYDKRNRKLKINTRLVNDAEAFFEEIKAGIA